MNILRRVEVEGFWGTKSFAIDFHPDVNFLIGVNGSGKTTLINMIAAALNPDLAMLDRMPFEKITIHFAGTTGQRKPSIEIQKVTTGDSPFPQISYRIRDRAGDAGTAYGLGDFQHRVIGRDPIMARERGRRASSAMVEHLRRLVNLSWLSIHRSQSLGQREERSFESTVDKKLDQMANELIKYFGLLFRQGEAEQAKFLQTVFLSLIRQQTGINLFDAMTKLDLASEQKALAQIFEQFLLNQQDFSPAIVAHFEAVQSAITAMKEREGFNTMQLSAVLAMARIHSLVQDWHKFGENQRLIYEPREAFLGMLNRMMVRKKFRVSDKNELVTEISDSGTQLPLPELAWNSIAAASFAVQLDIRSETWKRPHNRQSGYSNVSPQSQDAKDLCYDPRRSSEPHSAC